MAIRKTHANSIRQIAAIHHAHTKTVATTHVKLSQALPALIPMAKHLRSSLHSSHFDPDSPSKDPGSRDTVRMNRADPPSQPTTLTPKTTSIRTLRHTMQTSIAANIRITAKAMATKTAMRIGHLASAPIHARHAIRPFLRLATSNGISTRHITPPPPHSAPTPSPPTPPCRPA